IRIGGEDAGRAAGDGGVVVIDAIKQEVVVAVARTVYRNAAGEVDVGVCARREQDQFVRIAREQRKVGDRLIGNQRRELRGFCFDGGELRTVNFHDFLYGSDLQRSIQRQDLRGGERRALNVDGC